MLQPSRVNCQRCVLACGRHMIVDGNGPLDAPLMVVAEAPGREEDKTGVPLVGQSGKLLRTTLQQIAHRLGVEEFKVYYTNSVKCRPPDNRDPEPEELRECRQWLAEELETVKPWVILTVGRFAEEQVPKALSFVSWPSMRPWPIIVSAFHPAYILRQRRKTKEWEKQLAAAVMIAYPRVATLPVEYVPWQLFGDIDAASPWLSADTETDDLEEGVAVRRVGWSLSDGVGGWFGTDDPVAFDHLYLHNAPYDLPLLGVDPWNLSKYDDTMSMAHCLRRFDRVGLKELAPELTGVTWKYKIPELLRERVKTEKTLKSGKVKVTEKWVKVPFSRALEVRPEDCTEYAATDAVATARLACVLEAEFDKAPWAREYYKEFHKPLIPIVVGMQQRGVRIDIAALDDAEHEIVAARDAAELEFRQLVGYAGNMRSGPQLGEYLLAEGLVDGKLTETGDIGTGKANILAAFRVEKVEQLPDDPAGHAARALLEFKGMDKLKGTYVDALRSKRDSADRVHGRFNQCATDTDRWSSNDPNLQNIPIRTRVGKRIRDCFVAKPGHVLVVGDYSQLELRIFAEIMNDRLLKEVFVGALTRGHEPDCKCDACDPHSALGREIGIPRGDAKNTYYASLYGAEDAKIAATAHIARGEASAFLSRLRERSPSILEWRQRVVNELNEKGYVETLQGFRGYYPLWLSPLRREQQDALRAAINCPIQGTAAGVVKRLMIAAHNYEYQNWQARWMLREMVETLCLSLRGDLLLQVHDELVWEVPEREAPEFAEDFASLGTAVGRIDLPTVPLRLDVHIVDRWGDAK
jgi:uracil-DNA glycosylase family 4